MFGGWRLAMLWWIDESHVDSLSELARAIFAKGLEKAPIVGKKKMAK